MSGGWRHGQRRWSTRAHIYRGPQQGATTWVDPNVGREGYYSCPSCGRYVLLNRDGNVRNHNMGGYVGHVPCPGGYIGEE